MADKIMDSFAFALACFMIGFTIVTLITWSINYGLYVGIPVAIITFLLRIIALYKNNDSVSPPSS